MLDTINLLGGSDVPTSDIEICMKQDEVVLWILDEIISTNSYARRHGDAEERLHKSNIAPSKSDFDFEINQSQIGEHDGYITFPSAPTASGSKFDSMNF